MSDSNINVNIIEPTLDEQIDRIQWALDGGIVVPGNTDETFRVVETWYVGGPSEIQAYLAGMKAARDIDNGTYPSYQHPDSENRYTTEPHESVQDRYDNG